MQAVNLFCLPFAGGSKYVFQGFMRRSTGPLNVIPLELPGRGARMRESRLTDVHLMAEDVLRQIIPLARQPYAILGHSMGTLLGFLAARRMAQRRLPLPAHLFMTGSMAPAVREPGPKRHLLPRDAFVEEIKSLGGSPDEVFASAPVMALFEPIIRADFQALETYAYEPADKLDIPITVLTGTGENITDAQAMAWREETSARFEFRRLPGKHFFIFDHEAFILRLITERLALTAYSHERTYVPET